MTIIAYAALILTTLLLIASTLWRLRRPIDAALLVPLAWLALIPLQVLVFGTLRGYSGAPRDNMYISIALGNLSFVGLQVFLGSSYHRRLGARLRQLFAPAGEQPAPDWDRIATLWWYGLAVVAVGLGVIHLALMPKVPLFEVLSGYTDAYQISIDRENAAKLLAAPAIVRYLFLWNSAILLPILFVAAILFRWRFRAILIGLFGLMYVMAPLNKFPSLVFVLSAFVAIAIRDQKPALSRLLIVGFFVSLVPAYLITESGAISVAVHNAIGAPLSPATQPPPTQSAPPSSETPITSVAGVGLPGPVANFLDLTLRRIGAGPADVTYQWFSYFPAVHPFLNGSGWAPWNVLSSGYQKPANMVGLWAYYGKAGYPLTSITAYTGFAGDGWAEFGYAGVLIACLWLFLFTVVVELMRVFSDRAFCLACYVPCVLMLAATAPIAGVMAITFSAGLSLAPVICLAYLLSGRFGRRAAMAVQLRAPNTRAAKDTIAG